MMMMMMRWNFVCVCVFLENFRMNHLVKEFWKSVHICQSYCETSSGILFWDTVYIYFSLCVLGTQSDSSLMVHQQTYSCGCGHRFSDKTETDSPLQRHVQCWQDHSSLSSRPLLTSFELSPDSDGLSQKCRFVFHTQILNYMHSQITLKRRYYK